MSSASAFSPRGVPLTHCGNTWTTAKFWAFIRSGLRAKFTRWPPKFAVLKAAQRPSKSENMRLKWEFQCSICHGWFPQRSVEVDHIVPCGTLKSFDDLSRFAQRLFCEKEGLRVVCKPCHLGVTRGEKHVASNH